MLRLCFGCRTDYWRQPIIGIVVICRFAGIPLVGVGGCRGNSLLDGFACHSQGAQNVIHRRQRPRSPAIHAAGGVYKGIAQGICYQVRICLDGRNNGIKSTFDNCKQRLQNRFWGVIENIFEIMPNRRKEIAVNPSVGIAERLA